MATCTCVRGRARLVRSRPSDAVKRAWCGSGLESVCHDSGSTSAARVAAVRRCGDIEPRRELKGGIRQSADAGFLRTNPQALPIACGRGQASALEFTNCHAIALHVPDAGGVSGTTIDMPSDHAILACAAVRCAATPSVSVLRVRLAPSVTVTSADCCQRQRGARQSCGESGRRYQHGTAR